MPKPIDALSALHADYDVMLCDVWGVLHNGVTSFDTPKAALAEARRAGKTVILLTNSPRLAPSVKEQLGHFGVTGESFDAIVTSGDVTRTLVAEGPRKLYYLGPKRDSDLYPDTGVEQVGEAEAQGILCSGFEDDETETPEDYRDLLLRFAARKLPLICANPDLMVSRGDRLIPCAGALAALYAELGGETRIAGKPYSPIYDTALAKARELRVDVDTARVLAIGDGMPTDVRGAIDYGLDLLFVAEGIHEADYAVNGKVDEASLDRFLTQHGAHPKYWMTRLA